MISPVVAQIKAERIHREAWFSAVRNQSEDEIKQMIAEGFDVDTMHEGQSALHLCVCNNYDRSLRVILENASPKLEELSADGYTPLLSAILRSPAMCMQLLQAGAQANLADEKGDTPLHIICQFQGMGVQMQSVIEGLILLGADPDQPNLTGKTPRDMIGAKFEHTLEIMDAAVAHVNARNLDQSTDYVLPSSPRRSL